MPTTEQLYLRALRMLHDGQQHAAAAMTWARIVAGDPDESEIPPDPQQGFTLRELSLGAHRW